MVQMGTAYFTKDPAILKYLECNADLYGVDLKNIAKTANGEWVIMEEIYNMIVEHLWPTKK